MVGVQGGHLQPGSHESGPAHPDPRRPPGGVDPGVVRRVVRRAGRRHVVRAARVQSGQDEAARVARSRAGPGRRARRAPRRPRARRPRAARRPRRGRRAPSCRCAPASGPASRRRSTRRGPRARPRRRPSGPTRSRGGRTRPSRPGTTGRGCGRWCAHAAHRCGRRPAPAAGAARSSAGCVGVRARRCSRWPRPGRCAAGSRGRPAHRPRSTTRSRAPGTAARISSSRA